MERLSRTNKQVEHIASLQLGREIVALAVRSLGSAGYCHFIDSMPYNDQASLHAAVQSMRDRANVTGHVVTNGLLAGEEYQIFTIDRPSVADNALAEAIKWPVISQINRPIEDMSFDYFDLDYSSPVTSKPQIMVVAANTLSINAIKEVCDISHLNIQTIGIPELACLALLSDVKDVQNSCAFIRWLPTGGHMLIIKNGVLAMMGFLPKPPSEINEAFGDSLVLSINQLLFKYQKITEEAVEQLPIWVSETDAHVNAVIDILQDHLNNPIQVLEINNRVVSDGQPVDLSGLDISILGGLVGDG